MSKAFREELGNLKDLARYAPESAQAAISGMLREGGLGFDQEIEERRQDILTLEALIHNKQRELEEDILRRAGNHIVRALQDENIAEAAKIWQKFAVVHADHKNGRLMHLEYLQKELMGAAEEHNEGCRELAEMGAEVSPRLMLKAVNGTISLPSSSITEKENDEGEDDAY